MFAVSQSVPEEGADLPLARQTTKSTASAPLRFLALGDSYTTGEGVAESERWPVQLVDALRVLGYPFAPPEIIARTGWTTGELASAIHAAVLNPPYELVSLLIGVNNQYRGCSREEYRAEFTDLLTQAIAFAGVEPGRVLVVSIPDWGVTPHGERFDRGAISDDIDAFNAINRQEAERLGANYIDVTPISQGAAEEPDLIASDGLHPSGKMYAGWAELALPVVMEALSGYLKLE